MRLAISGEILAIHDRPPLSGPEAADAGAPAGGGAIPGSPSGAMEGDALWRVAEVDFGGVRQSVSLACLPQARVGDRVLVHVGFALALVDEDGEPWPP